MEGGLKEHERSVTEIPNVACLQLSINSREELKWMWANWMVYVKGLEYFSGSVKVAT